MTIDTSSPEFKAAVDAAVKQQLDEQLAGLKANRDEILREKVGLKEKHAEEVAAITAKYQDYRLRTEAVTAIAKAGGFPELLLPHVIGRLRLDDDRVTVVNEQGQTRVKDKGAAFTLDDLVAEFRASDTFSVAFRASGASGSGAGGTARGVNTSTMTRSAFNALPAAERVARSKAGIKLTD